MKRLFRRLLILALICLAGAIGYGWLGYRDARDSAESLRARADALIEAGRGDAALGVDRRRILIAVEDPAFLAHKGIDFTTPGAGSTTISQAVAHWLVAEEFQPDIASLWQTGYAFGLEQELTKPQILALFLDTVEMGPGPDGDWITGFWSASEAHFGAEPGTVTLEEYLYLVAVIIAPGELSLAVPGTRLQERAARIGRLAAGECRPLSHDDVWLEGCGGA